MEPWNPLGTERQDSPSLARLSLVAASPRGDLLKVKTQHGSATARRQRGLAVRRPGRAVPRPFPVEVGTPCVPHAPVLARVLRPADRPPRIFRKYLLAYQQSSYKHNAVKTKWSGPGPRYGALIQLLRTAETLWNSSRVFFAGWDLSPSQFNILNLLYEQAGGLSQIELSRQLVMHRSNVTGLVDRLEQRGLVDRRDTPEDRRAYRVVLTGAGRRLLREVLPFYYQAAEEVWGNLPVQRAHQLVAELAEVCAQAERTAAAMRDRP